jgi:PAS domain S-box-containing protein
VVRAQDEGSLYYEGTVEDITERRRAEEALRESEERYRSVIAALEEGIIVVDPEGLVRACNAAAERILGIRAAQMVGRTAVKDWEMIDQHGIPFLYEEQPHWYSFKTGQPRSNIVVGLRKLAGEPTWISINSQPLFQPNENRPHSVVLSFTDITERKLAEERLKSSREQLRALTAHLQLVREEERTRIAREIHDELGQSLTALKMDLSWLGCRLSDEQTHLTERVRCMSTLVDSTMQVVRRISAELRPGVLDDLGLTAAIEWQVQEFQNRTGVKCQFASDPEDIAIDQARSTAVFRILQESLTNIARHANSSKVSIRLKEKHGELTLEVRDNGCGITRHQASSPRSLGLIGMRERALLWGGKLNVSGIVGRGTRVKVRIPIEKFGEAVETQ